MTAPSPIACRMDSLTPAERKRRSEVLAILTPRTVAVVEADGGAVRLALGGGEGVREFLRATFG